LAQGCLDIASRPSIIASHQYLPFRDAGRMAGRLTKALLGFSESVKSFPFLPVLCDWQIAV